MRKIETHKVNGCNEAIGITVHDEPGCGGACHRYVMKFTKKDGSREAWGINFQDGPVAEAGVNGVTHEALLAILIDRLEGFQRGPFACHAYAHALSNLRAALDCLQERTRERLARGVEGTHKL